MSLQPFLLSNLCGRADGDLKIDNRNANTVANSVDELLSRYLHGVTCQPFGGQVPTHCLFNRKVQGALCAWLAQPPRLETRVLLHNFFLHILDFKRAQEAHLSLHVRLKKSVLHYGTSQVTADAERAALASVELARSEAPQKESAVVQSKPKQKTHAAAHAAPAAAAAAGVVTGVRKVPPLLKLSSRSKSSLSEASVVTHDIMHAGAIKLGKDTQQLLERLLTELRCEMVEVVAAPTKNDPTKQRLVSTAAVHPSAVVVRRYHKSRPWSEVESTPVGLCAAKRETVQVENGHFTCDAPVENGRYTTRMEGEFALPYDVCEISQLCVPIFEFQQNTMANVTTRASQARASTTKLETVDGAERKLLGVLRCHNKYASSSSRAGFAFLDSDASLVRLFASLIAEQAAKEVSNLRLARQLQRIVNQRRRKI